MSSNLEIPELYFSIVSNCLCDDRRISCMLCNAEVCLKHGDLHKEMCNLCIDQLKTFPKGAEDCMVYLCGICDNINYKRKFAKISDTISICSNNSMLTLFLCNNCDIGRIRNRDYISQEDATAAMRFLPGSIPKKTYFNNMLNYKIINDTRKLLMQKIKKEVLIYYLPIIAEIITEYCGYKRYIMYEQDNTIAQYI